MKTDREQTFDIQGAGAERNHSEIVCRWVDRQHRDLAEYGVTQAFGKPVPSGVSGPAKLNRMIQDEVLAFV
ncbi:hypothetical protein RRSWK_06537 [Rhodopirellula sp. SWK7]|nr:hypothetical protein RRSWK_06537 [Rhodopirellula sp. SWK7]